jgi:hypothetical protein
VPLVWRWYSLWDPQRNGLLAAVAHGDSLLFTLRIAICQPRWPSKKVP